MKRVLASLGSPEFLRGFHGWSTAFWPLFTVLSFWAGWLKSVTFVSLMSMVALFLGSFSSWQASRVEVKEDQEMPEMIEDVFRRVLADETGKT